MFEKVIQSVQQNSIHFILFQAKCGSALVNRRQKVVASINGIFFSFFLSFFLLRLLFSWKGLSQDYEIFHGVLSKINKLVHNFISLHFTLTICILSESPSTLFVHYHPISLLSQTAAHVTLSFILSCQLCVYIRVTQLIILTRQHSYIFTVA